MSELLRKLAAHVRAASDPDLHVVAGQDWSDDDSGSMMTASEPQLGKAELVDPKGSVDGVPVGDPEPGRLAYFMDGIERKHVPLYCSMVPVVYGYVAAAIRRRDDDRRMRTHLHQSREALYFPYRLVTSEVFHAAGMHTENTETGEKPLDEHPIILREAARVAVSKSRGRIENELAKNWLDAFTGGDDWLLVDGSLGGTLGGDFQKRESPNIIGVIKSHQTQYFPMEEQRAILGLRVGERSGVFMPMGRERRSPVYSWYLRLRPSDGRDVYFGLIRIEAPANERTLQMVDEISRWLLAERRPLSLPDGRWDKMFYPIRDCEQYLRSLAPTKTVLQASMIGFGGR
ncbi:MAG: hypothetical protein M1133_12130 [Armatimonadetes bacterium]|nr:hypothetical protein [Armatimonadota bacterium]